jgi:hypothetical protein
MTAINAPEDLDVLHAIVCADYARFRAAGGRADSPYLPFYLETASRMNFARLSDRTYARRSGRW